MADPRSEVCSFFIKVKNRTCKFQCQPGYKYCAEHLVCEGAASHDRMPCPCDPKHTVQKSKLQEHLKRCNSRPKPAPAHFSRNINIRDEGRAQQPDATGQQTLAGLAKVLDGSSVPVPLERVSEDRIPDLALLGTNGVQNESLATLIKDALKAPEAIFVELGAGKGGLSLYIAKRCSEVASKSLFLLVDRKNSRRKADASLRHLGINFARHFIDIKDLDLDLLIPPQTQTVVFSGKHLCGAATCLSLNAIASLAQKRPTLDILIVIATCCHQVCDWNALAGREFFKTDGLSPLDFERMRKCSSWAVCQHRIPCPEEVKIDPVSFAKMIKVYLDSCRLRMLGDLNFDCRYLEYTREAVSPENRAILATRYGTRRPR